MGYWKDYIRSFKLTNDFWMTLTVDFIFFGIMMMVFSWFSDYVQGKSILLMQGKTPEQLQELFLSSPADAAPYLNDLTTFLITFLVILAILLLLTFFGFSLIQAMIWNHLLGKRLSSKNYWRWNALHVTLLFPLLIYGLLFFILKLITGGIFNFLLTLNETFYFQHVSLVLSTLKFLNAGTGFILAVPFLLFLFLVYVNFVKEYRVWFSIGEGLRLSKVHRKKIVMIAFFSLVSMIGLTMVLLPFQSLVRTSFLLTGIDLLFLLAFVSWLRIYFLKMVNFS